MECSDSKVGFVRSVEGYIHLLPKCVCIVALITQIHLIANHPDKSKIGKEVEIINLHHSNFNPQKGYVDEWLYNVWDGAKSLGWAPECDLVINKPS